MITAYISLSVVTLFLGIYIIWAWKELSAKKNYWSNIYRANIEHRVNEYKNTTHELLAEFFSIAPYIKDTKHQQYNEYLARANKIEYLLRLRLSPEQYKFIADAIAAQNYGLFMEATNNLCDMVGKYSHDPEKILFFHHKIGDNKCSNMMN